MINCRYNGTRETNAHPYLIGTSGYCTKDVIELVRKYKALKSAYSTKHKSNCDCQKCIDLKAFGSAMVEYELELQSMVEDTEHKEYRVHIKHIDIIDE